MRDMKIVWLTDGLTCQSIDLSACVSYRPTGHALLPRPGHVEITDSAGAAGPTTVAPIAGWLEGRLAGARVAPAIGFARVSPRVSTLYRHEPSDLWFVVASTGGFPSSHTGYFAVTREEAQSYLSANRYAVETVTPGQVRRDEATESRDKFIYDECVKGTPYGAIGAMVRKHREWAALDTTQGVKDAGARHAQRHGKPSPPSRQAGRPPKAKKSKHGPC